jgi:UDP-glucose:glycoprotein glucosyltransferase
MLYASLASDNFRPLHDVLFSLAKQPTPHIEYILRHVPPTSRETSARTYLSGYGVALDLKKTDYLAVDDRHSSRSGVFARLITLK